MTLCQDQIIELKTEIKNISEKSYSKEIQANEIEEDLKKKEENLRNFNRQIKNKKLDKIINERANAAFQDYLNDQSKIFDKISNSYGKKVYFLFICFLIKLIKALYQLKDNHFKEFSSIIKETYTVYKNKMNFFYFNFFIYSFNRKS